MSVIIIFAWVILTFLIMAYLEKTIEGPNAWGKKSYGWKFRISKRISITEYHLSFGAFITMMSLLPLVIYGFNLVVFGILVSAFSIGLIFEDFFYFIVNPYFGLKKFNEKNARWYPWLKLGSFQIPVSYILGIIISLVSWYFLWRY